MFLFCFARRLPAKQNKNSKIGQSKKIVNNNNKLHRGLTTSRLEVGKPLFNLVLSLTIV